MPQPPRTTPAAQQDREPAWLLLVHELPARPSNARVKTWRRLQSLGAVAVKDSVYVLPNTPQSREDFEWMAAEITGMKGQATLFAANQIEDAGREDLVALFQRARQRDYIEMAGAARALLRAARREGRGSRAAQALRERLSRVAEIDFFSAPGRDAAFAAVEALQQRMERRAGRAAGISKAEEGSMKGKFQNRTWVTRPRPGIDRMSSAWLIRRFVDPQARFAFAEKPKAGSPALPFDMYGVEFGHQGNHCTFETLAGRFSIVHPAVKQMGEIVHDLDLKEDRYGRPESVAVGRMVEGLRLMYRNDRELLEQGITMMEALFQSLAGSSSKGSAGQMRRARNRTHARR